MGGANSNTSDHKIVVRDIVALRQVWVAPLDEGTEATIVTKDDERWVLHKSRGDLVDDGVSIVAPASGSPSAGAPGARWIKEVSCGIDQVTELMLLTNQSTSAFALSVIPGMSTVVTTKAPPEGGTLLLDFSGVFQLEKADANVNVIEANIAIFVDNIRRAVATFNHDFQNQIPQPNIETVAMTRELSLLPGNHTIDVRWGITDNANLSSGPGTEPDRFFVNLRIVEVCGG